MTMSWTLNFEGLNCCRVLSSQPLHHYDACPVDNAPRREIPLVTGTFLKNLALSRPQSLSRHIHHDAVDRRGSRLSAM
jgi:hypothetical protein